MVSKWHLPHLLDCFHETSTETNYGSFLDQASHRVQEAKARDRLMALTTLVVYTDWIDYGEGYEQWLFSSRRCEAQRVSHVPATGLSGVLLPQLARWRNRTFV